MSQIQSKYKAASCNACIKDINISNIGGRVNLKVTFSQQNTEHINFTIITGIILDISFIHALHDAALYLLCI
jgi:hypothetical protein